MLFASKKSKNNWILHGGRVRLAGKADNARQSETCRSWEVFLVSGQLKPPWAQLSTPKEHVSPSRQITAPTHWESPQGRDGKGPDPVKKPKPHVQTGCGILKNTPEPCDLPVPSHTQIQPCPLCLTLPSFPGTQQPCPGTWDSLPLPEQSVLSPELFSRPQCHRATSHSSHWRVPAQLIQSSLGDTQTPLPLPKSVFSPRRRIERSVVKPGTLLT